MIVHFLDGTNIECDFKEFQQMVSAGYICNAEKAVNYDKSENNSERKVLSKSAIANNIDL